MFDGGSREKGDLDGSAGHRVDLQTVHGQHPHSDEDFIAEGSG